MTVTEQPSAVEPLTVVGWLWQGGVYTPERANIWARMIDRHLSMPHRFVLVTDHSRDRWGEFDPLIEAVPLWDDWRELKNNAWGDGKPQCYVRLKAFSRQAREIFGERFVSIDLDIVVLAELDPLFDRKEDFLIIRRTPLNASERSSIYQGSMWMMKAGARAKVFEEFCGEESIRLASQFMGTDQAWIAYALGPDESGWTEEDGVWCFRNIQRAGLRYSQRAPESTRIVVFNSAQKPWDFSARAKKPKRQRCHQCGALLRTEQTQSDYPWIARSYH